MYVETKEKSDDSTELNTDESVTELNVGESKAAALHGEDPKDLNDILGDDQIEDSFDSQAEEEVEDKEYILPDSSEKLLVEEDLIDLSAEELMIARNEIYARHGLIFKNRELSDYFSEKEWYTPSIESSNWDSNCLTYLEKKNISFIKNAEKNKGNRESGQYIVDSADGGANMREGPGTEYEIVISMIPNGTELEVLEIEKSSKGSPWGKIKYKGEEGWIAMSLFRDQLVGD